MHPIFSKCPVCGQELIATRLECRSCSTDISGQFSVGGLARLSAEDIEFVETFVKNRGNAYKVGEELELPYSAVRARLTDVIRTMGFEPSADVKDEPAPEIPPEKRKKILTDLAKGKISADDAVKLLQGETS